MYSEKIEKIKSMTTDFFIRPISYGFAEIKNRPQIFSLLRESQESSKCSAEKLEEVVIAKYQIRQFNVEVKTLYKTKKISNDNLGKQNSLRNTSVYTNVIKKSLKKGKKLKRRRRS